MASTYAFTLATSGRPGPVALALPEDMLRETSSVADADPFKTIHAADPSRNFPIEALGSGSDFSPFLDHLGIPVLDVSFGDEGKTAGVYHSRYDTLEHHRRFVDPGFIYDALLAGTIGRLVLRAAAEERVPAQHVEGFGEAVSEDLNEVKKLADDEREAAETQAQLLHDHAFHLSDDPTESSGLPTALGPVPHIEFAALEDAVDRLKRIAKEYDDTLAKTGSSLSDAGSARLQELMLDIDQLLAPGVGPPGRSWYKNLIYAPGRFTGYDAKTLPSVREAIEERRWADANRYVKLTAELERIIDDPGLRLLFQGASSRVIPHAYSSTVKKGPNP